ncbi:MAG: DUF4160 domain-containing protein [Bacteroidota bacterium]
MGTIHIIRNIKIYIYSRDHNPPHLHAVYAEYEVVLNIKTLIVIKGDMPGKQLKEIKTWLDNEELKRKLIELFYNLNPQLRKGK